MKTYCALLFFAAQALFAAVHYSYDAAGRLSRIDYDSGGSIVYTYDKAGNLLGRTATAAPAGGPSVISTDQTSGATSSQSFTFKFSDTAGAQSLSVLNVLINNFLDGRHACYLAYVVSTSTLVLVDDGGDAGGPYAGSVALGNPGVAIQNSQCSVNLVSAAPSGNDFSLGLNITFKPSFGGNKIQYLAARDAIGNSDWQAMGVWQAPPYTPPGAISAGSPTPARLTAAAGTAQPIAFTLTDSKGSADFGVVNVLLNNFIDGRQACYLAYRASDNSLLLVDDGGNAGGPFAGSMVLGGGAAFIENSQCRVTAAGSSATPNGNTLTLQLNIAAKTPLSGNRVIWVAGRDRADGNNTDWQSVATWSVR